MNRYLATMASDQGSALLIVIVLIPVLTLFCIFASNVSVQDMMVTANDNCHRYALYDADGALYGTAKLISLVDKSKTRQAVAAGAGNAAPGIEYVNSDADPADFFARKVAAGDSSDTTTVKFVKTTNQMTDPPDKDFGLGSTVDIVKNYSDNSQGGGAEFGNASAGIGAQINRIRFRMSANTIDPATGVAGGSLCPNTAVTLNGDYWLIVTAGGQTKGI